MEFGEEGYRQMDDIVDGDAKKWVLAGIALRSSVKPIFTRPTKKNDHNEDDEEECCVTPKSEEARIPSRLTCPPAPKKRKSTSRWHYNRGVRQFFNPPDLETVFILRAEKA